MPEVPDAQAFLDPDASREYLRSWQENVDRVAARAAADRMRHALEPLNTSRPADEDESAERGH